MTVRRDCLRFSQPQRVEVSYAGAKSGRRIRRRHSCFSKLLEVSGFALSSLLQHPKPTATLKTPPISLLPHSSALTTSIDATPSTTSLVSELHSSHHPRFA
ncbi:hypothetical protein BKA81DRAFT_344882 [Phyllosticta paracitricarpa]